MRRTSALGGTDNCQDPALACRASFVLMLAAVAILLAFAG
jgi:hypothetical protein